MTTQGVALSIPPVSVFGLAKQIRKYPKIHTLRAQEARSRCKA